MIVQSCLIRRRDNVPAAEFSKYFRNGQKLFSVDPLYARAYTQNYRVRRWDLPEATFLPRIDAYTQMWFDDISLMLEDRHAVQQELGSKKVEHISDMQSVTIQQPGPLLGGGTKNGSKLALVLAGDPDNALHTESSLYQFLDSILAGKFVLRVNRMLESPYATPIKPQLAALVEIWLPNDHYAEAVLNLGILEATGALRIATTMLVNETVILKEPEL